MTSILSAAELQELRGLEEGDMVDACQITAPSTTGPVLDGDLNYSDPDEVVVYTGPCGLSGPPTGDITSLSAQGAIIQPVEVKVPVEGSEQVRPGQLVKITASTYDEGLVHRQFRIHGITRSSFATRRRLQCVEITGGA